MKASSEDTLKMSKMCDDGDLGSEGAVLKENEVSTEKEEKMEIEREKKMEVCRQIAVSIFGNMI